MDSFPELKNFYMNEMNSDITLVVDGHRLPAHKFVLSAKSTVFNAMLFGNLMEATAREVVIKEAPIDAFKVLLKYIYSEEFCLDNEKDFAMAIEVFKLGHRFQLHRLVHTIEQSIIKMLKKHNYLRVCDTLSMSYDDFLSRRRFDTSLLVVIENIALVYEFALLYELQELINSCHRFIAKNSKLIIKKKSFFSKSFDIMEAILAVMNANQTLIIYALQKIRDSNPASDLRQFERLVDFELCSVDDINSLRNINMFSNDRLFEVLINKYKSLQTENSKLLKEKRV